jgi:hypothetical protein
MEINKFGIAFGVLVIVLIATFSFFSGPPTEQLGKFTGVGKGPGVSGLLTYHSSGTSYFLTGERNYVVVESSPYYSDTSSLKEYVLFIDFTLIDDINSIEFDVLVEKGSSAGDDLLRLDDVQVKALDCTSSTGCTDSTTTVWGSKYETITIGSSTSGTGNRRTYPVKIEIPGKADVDFASNEWGRIVLVFKAVRAPSVLGKTNPNPVEIKELTFKDTNGDIIDEDTTTGGYTVAVLSTTSSTTSPAGYNGAIIYEIRPKASEATYTGAQTTPTPSTIAYEYGDYGSTGVAQTCTSSPTAPCKTTVHIAHALVADKTETTSGLSSYNLIGSTSGELDVHRGNEYYLAIKFKVDDSTTDYKVASIGFTIEDSNSILESAEASIPKVNGIGPLYSYTGDINSLTSAFSGTPSQAMAAISLRQDSSGNVGASITSDQLVYIKIKIKAGASTGTAGVKIKDLVIGDATGLKKIVNFGSSDSLGISLNIQIKDPVPVLFTDNRPLTLAQRERFNCQYDMDYTATGNTYAVLDYCSGIVYDATDSYSPDPVRTLSGSNAKVEHGIYASGGSVTSFLTLDSANSWLASLSSHYSGSSNYVPGTGTNGWLNNKIPGQMSLSKATDSNSQVSGDYVNDPYYMNRNEKPVPEIDYPTASSTPICLVEEKTCTVNSDCSTGYTCNTAGLCKDSNGNDELSTEPDACEEILVKHSSDAGETSDSLIDLKWDLDSTEIELKDSSGNWLYTPSVSSFDWTPTKIGSQTMRLTAVDTYNGTDDHSVTFTVLANHKPEAIIDSPDPDASPLDEYQCIAHSSGYSCEPVPLVSGSTDVDTGDYISREVWYKKQSGQDDLAIYPSSEGLVLHLPFTEKHTTSGTVTDLSGNDNDGTLASGTASPSWKRYGRTPAGNGAYDFDGRDEIKVDDDASLDIKDEVTLAFWVKHDGSAISGCTSSGNPTNCHQYILFKGWGGLDVGIYQQNLNRINFKGTYAQISHNSWQQVVFTQKGSTVKVYVNGALQRSISNAALFSMDNTDDLYIGRRAVTDGFGGYLDDIRIYDVELTAAEVLALANDQVPIPEKEAVLNMPFTFDSKTVYDYSGEDNDGTKNNDVEWTRLGMPGIGGSYKFDGDMDYIEATLLSEITTAGTYTFSAWVNIKDDTSSSRNSIFQNVHSASDRNGMDADNGHIKFGYYDGSSWTGVNGAYDKNKWVHVAGVNDGGSISLYINGVSQSGTSSPYANTRSKLILGYTPSSGGGATFNGAMDEVLIFSDALSADEIEVLYKLGEQPADASLELEYLFSEDASTVEDSSGNNNDGTKYGDITWTSTERPSGAYNFDGTDDYVGVPDSNSLDLSTSTSSDLTLSAWIFPEDCTKSARQTIITKSSAYYMNLGSVSGGNCGFYFYWYGLSTPGYHYSSQNIAPNEWSHVAATYSSSSQEIKLYVNKQVTTISSITGTGRTNAQSLKIGGAGSTGRYFDGRIDNVKIYNEVLTEDEISQLYAYSSPNYAPEYSEVPTSGTGSTTIDLKLEVEDSRGATDTADTDFKITLNEPPVAIIDEPAASTAGLPQWYPRQGWNKDSSGNFLNDNKIRLTGSSSTDDDNTIDEYLWKFDGTSIAPSTGSSDDWEYVMTSTRSTTSTWDGRGLWTDEVGLIDVSLTVKDNFGQKDTETESIAVGIGDVNDDGKLDGTDVTASERTAVKMKDASQTPAVAYAGVRDANQDGVINVLDITRTELIVIGNLYKTSPP